MEKIIEFGNIGTHLGTRFAGASVREKILADFDTVEKVAQRFSCFWIFLNKLLRTTGGFGKVYQNTNFLI